MKRIRSLALCLALAVAPLSLGCSNNRAPVLVAQTGVAVSQSIGNISSAAAQLEKAGTLPTAAALNVQQTLLKANTALKPLPDILRTIDAAQKAGDSVEGDVDKAIAILQVVSPEIATVLAGVPVAETTRAFVDLVRAAQQAVTTATIELAKLKGGN